VGKKKEKLTALFQQHHLPAGTELTRLKAIQIDTRRQPGAVEGDLVVVYIPPTVYSRNFSLP